MSDFDWRAVVRNTAPVLGAALGGPMAGAAIKVLGDALLGKPDATEAEVAEVLSGPLSGEQRVAMQSAQLNFQLEMRRLDETRRATELEETRVMVADTSDARHVYSADSRVFWLGIAVLGTFTLLMASIVIGCFFMVSGEKAIDPSLLAVVAGLIGTIAGYVAANAQQVISFFFGSSKGSKDSGDAVRRALDSTTAALKDAQSR